MSEDWKAGDIAVCVPDSECVWPGAHPLYDSRATVSGRAWRVIGTEAADANFFPKVRLWLHLDGHDFAICAGCCRKLNDGEDDLALIARIKGKRPVREKEGV